jgi:hypothetical protein
MWQQTYFLYVTIFLWKWKSTLSIENIIFIFLNINSQAVKVKVKLSRYTPWRRMGGEEVYLLLILNLGHRDGTEGSTSRPGRALPPGCPLTPI